MAKFTLAAVTALALTMPALAQQARQPLPEARTPAEAQAQYERGYNGPRSPDATGNNPGTTALNTAVGAAVDLRARMNAAEQAQYDADMDAWAKGVVSAAQQKSRDRAWHDNQQRAYADAMYAWRLQVAACQRGHVRACNAPSPRPEDFY